MEFSVVRSRFAEIESCFIIIIRYKVLKKKNRTRGNGCFDETCVGSDENNRSQNDYEVLNEANLLLWSFPEQSRSSFSSRKHLIC